MDELTPMTQQLDRAGIAFRIENTGGNVMVLFVTLASGVVVGISWDGFWIVCEYASRTDIGSGYDRPYDEYARAADVLTHLKNAENPRQFFDSPGCGYLEGEAVHDNATVAASECGTCATNRADRLSPAP